MLAQALARATPRRTSVRIWLLAALLGAALVLPFAASTYLCGLITQALIYAILAMSLDLILGYTGLLSMGHAAFFGAGAYGVVVAVTHFHAPLWQGVLAGLVVPPLLALGIGYFCVRISGVAFLMLTLAFGQLLASAAITWRSLTGGTDGLGLPGNPVLFGIDLSQPHAAYWMALGGLVASFLFLRMIVAAPLGRALVGIRENETRMQAIGYPVRRYKLAAFALGGFVAGFAGVIFALYNGFVSTDMLGWGTSGDIILMAVLGGIGTLLGPAVGAIAFVLLREAVGAYTSHWQIVIGSIFIAAMLLTPDGIFTTLARRLVTRPGAGEPVP